MLARIRDCISKLIGRAVRDSRARVPVDGCDNTGLTPASIAFARKADERYDVPGLVSPASRSRASLVDQMTPRVTGPDALASFALEFERNEIYVQVAAGDSGFGGHRHGDCSHSIHDTGSAVMNHGQ